MKKLKLSLLLTTTLIFGLFAFSSIKVNGIRGKVLPLNSAEKVMAISGKDTLTTSVLNGNFAFSNIKKATYTIIIHAKPPYSDLFVENVAVLDSAITDIGTVQLKQ